MMDMTSNRTYQAFNWRFQGEGFRISPPLNDPNAERGDGRCYPPDQARCIAAELLIGEGDERVRRFIAYKMEKEMARMPFRDDSEVTRFVHSCLEEVKLVIRCAESRTEDDWDPESAFAG